MATRTIPSDPVTVPSITAPVQANGAPKRPFKVSYPLISWDDTRQNAVCIAFLLGATFALGLVNAGSLFSSVNATAASLKGEAASTASERLIAAIKSPRLGIYVVFLVVFHMAEFLTTAMYNPAKATVKCECQDSLTQSITDD